MPRGPGEHGSLTCKQVPHPCPVSRKACGGQSWNIRSPKPRQTWRKACFHQHPATACGIRRPCAPRLDPPWSVALGQGQAGCPSLTSLACRTLGTDHFAALLDKCASRLPRARAGLAVVGLASERVAIEAWQAALTRQTLCVVLAFADPWEFVRGYDQCLVPRSPGGPKKHSNCDIWSPKSQPTWKGQSGTRQPRPHEIVWLETWS